VRPKEVRNGSMKGREAKEKEKDVELDLC